MGGAGAGGGGRGGGAPRRLTKRELAGVLGLGVLAEGGELAELSEDKSYHTSGPADEDAVLPSRGRAGGRGGAGRATRARPAARGRGQKRAWAAAPAGAAEPFDAAREWDEFEAAFKLSLRRKGGAPTKVERAGVHTVIPGRGWLPSRGRGVEVGAAGRGGGGGHDDSGERGLSEEGTEPPAAVKRPSRAPALPRPPGPALGGKPASAGPMPSKAFHVLLTESDGGEAIADADAGAGGAEATPFHSGGVTVLRWGAIDPDLRTHSHMGKGYCCPVGFASCRTYTSTEDPNQRVWYLSKTRREEGQLVVEVVEVAGEWKTFSGSTPTEAWQKALLEVNRTSETRKRVTVSGPQFMGLSNDDIKSQISRLPCWEAWASRRG